MGENPTEPTRTRKVRTQLPTQTPGGNTPRRASRKPPVQIEASSSAIADNQPLEDQALSVLPLKRRSPAKKAPARRVAKGIKPSAAVTLTNSEPPAPKTTNFGAAEAFIVLLRNQERIADIDQARVTAFLTLAGAVDDDPTNAQLRKEYRLAEEGLRATEDHGTDVFEELLRAMSSQVGDTSNT